MKRIFNLFMKEIKTKYKNMSELTIMFNKWVMNAQDAKGIKRFAFKAFTNKFMIQKWMSKRGEFTF